MILTPKYCWERVQKHRITLEIQYHGLGTSIGTYIVGNAKNHVKKDQNCDVFFLPTPTPFFGLFAKHKN